jgi:hypothetical protein
MPCHRPSLPPTVPAAQWAFDFEDSSSAGRNGGLLGDMTLNQAHTVADGRLGHSALDLCTTAGSCSRGVVAPWFVAEGTGTVEEQRTWSLCMFIKVRSWHNANPCTLPPHPSNQPHVCCAVFAMGFAVLRGVCMCGYAVPLLLCDASSCVTFLCGFLALRCGRLAHE